MNMIYIYIFIFIVYIYILLIYSIYIYIYMKEHENQQCTGYYEYSACELYLLYLPLIVFQQIQ